jgi:hypothetical protein
MAHDTKTRPAERVRVEEPLAISAPLVWACAPRLCPDDPDGRDCLWYHRVWQYLRLLNVITTVRTNTDFLLEVFRDHARSGRFSRVLVSAAADYSMLAHLAHAYRAEGAPLHVTFVDRCGTAVFLNRWYADRYGVDLRAHECDVLAYRSSEPFDLVCTHNFLGRFVRERRNELIALWHDQLRVGGRVVTTQRIRPNATYARYRYSPDQARALATRVRRVASDHSGQLGVTPEQLSEAVYAYALRKGANVIQSRNEIRDAFLSGGFEIDRDDDGGFEERVRDRPSSPAGKDTFRMRLVATRLA